MHSLIWVHWWFELHIWGCIGDLSCIFEGALVIWAAYLRVHWWSWVLRANRKFTEVSRLNITKTWNATHSTFWLIVSCWTEVHHEELLPFVLPEGQKHILGLTAQDMRAFFFCTLFFFPKRKVCTSFLFYGQAVRPGLIAFQDVSPEMHTPQAVRPEVYTASQAVRPDLQLKAPQPKVVVRTSFLFALQAVRPEVHTGPARKGWTSLKWTRT